MGLLGDLHFLRSLFLTLLRSQVVPIRRKVFVPLVVGRFAATRMYLKFVRARKSRRAELKRAHRNARQANVAAKTRVKLIRQPRLTALAFLKKVNREKRRQAAALRRQRVVLTKKVRAKARRAATQLREWIARIKLTRKRAASRLRKRREKLMGEVRVTRTRVRRRLRSWRNEFINRYLPDERLAEAETARKDTPGSVVPDTDLSVSPAHGEQQDERAAGTLRRQRRG
jgi:hypothetical protein